MSETPWAVVDYLVERLGARSVTVNADGLVREIQMPRCEKRDWLTPAEVAEIVNKMYVLLGRRDLAHLSRIGRAFLDAAENAALVRSLRRDAADEKIAEAANAKPAVAPCLKPIPVPKAPRVATKKPKHVEPASLNSGGLFLSREEQEQVESSARRMQCVCGYCAARIRDHEDRCAECGCSDLIDAPPQRQMRTRSLHALWPAP